MSGGELAPLGEADSIQRRPSEPEIVVTAEQRQWIEQFVNAPTDGTSGRLRDEMQARRR